MYFKYIKQKFILTIIILVALFFSMQCQDIQSPKVRLRYVISVDDCIVPSSDDVDPLAIYQHYITDADATTEGSTNPFRPYLLLPREATADKEANDGLEATVIDHLGLNLPDISEKGTEIGKDIKVAILDSGIDVLHEDLCTNFDFDNSFNFITQTNDTTPILDEEGTDPSQKAHGTAIAGIIGAVHNNGVGIRGIAPGVSLGSYNTSDSGISIPILSYSIFKSKADIVNMSFAIKSSNDENINESYQLHYNIPVNSEDISDNEDAQLFDLFKEGIAQDRNYEDSTGKGLGILFLQAAGNDFRNIFFDGDAHPFIRCDYSNAIGSSCANSNTEEKSNNPYVITVASLAANDSLASYSSTGSNIFISAYGGGSEFAKDAILPMNVSPIDPSPFASISNLGMLTTDLLGCDQGYSQSESEFISKIANRDKRETFLNKLEQYKDFDLGTFRLDPDDASTAFNTRCNYTNRISGTSFAAPSIAGIIALMLEANPRLNWRDVKDILVKTAINGNNNTDLEQAGLAISYDGTEDVSIDNSPGCSADQADDPATLDVDEAQECVNTFKFGDLHADIDLGWQINNAGYYFHNAFGFGKPNTSAAIAMAATHSLLPSMEIITPPIKEDIDATITYRDDACPVFSGNRERAHLVDTIILVSRSLQVESVRVYLNINHPSPSDLEIKLISPQGTPSLIWHPFSGYTLNSLNEYSQEIQDMAEEQELNFVALDGMDGFLLTHAFYGEIARGTWTLEVRDVFDTDSRFNVRSDNSGSLLEWGLEIYGHCPDDSLNNCHDSDDFTPERIPPACP